MIAGLAVPALAGAPTPPLSGEAVGDPFRQTLFEIIARAAREGKRITVRRMNYVNDEIRLVPNQAGSAPVTSVTEVEIKEGEGDRGGESSALLRNQEALLRALTLLCQNQMEAGSRLARLAGQGDNLAGGLAGLTSGVDQVRDGVSGNSSQTADVSVLTADNAQILNAIASQIKSLNQAVEGLISSMGKVGSEIAALAKAVDDSAKDDSQKGDSGKSEGGQEGGAGEGSAAATGGDGSSSPGTSSGDSTSEASNEE